MVQFRGLLPSPDAFYLPTVVVWDPMKMYRVPVKCPRCKNTAKYKGWANKPRKVYGLHETYYILSRRYACNQCTVVSPGHEEEKDSDSEKDISSNAASTKTKIFTFLASSQNVLDQLPYHAQNAFPAILSKRSGLDKMVLREFESSVESSQGPTALANKIKENYCISFYQKFAEYLALIADLKMRQTNKTLSATERRIPPDGAGIPAFSDFADKNGYAGSIPSGKSLLQSRCHSNHAH
jgi:hypothetical protein